MLEGFDFKGFLKLNNSKILIGILIALSVWFGFNNYKREEFNNNRFLKIEQDCISREDSLVNHIVLIHENFNKEKVEMFKKITEEQKETNEKLTEKYEHLLGQQTIIKRKINAK